MPIDPTLQTTNVRHHQQGLVFAGDMRIATAGLGVNGGQVAEQEARRVDVVHQGFLYQKSAQIAEIGLAWIGTIAQTVAAAGAEAIADRRSYVAASDEITYCAMPGLPAP